MRLIDVDISDDSNHIIIELQDSIVNARKDYWLTQDEAENLIALLSQAINEIKINEDAMLGITYDKG